MKQHATLSRESCTHQEFSRSFEPEGQRGAKPALDGGTRSNAKTACCRMKSPALRTRWVLVFMAAVIDASCEARRR